MMKMRTLLLALVAAMTLLGTKEAFCQRPQRSKVHVNPTMDHRVRETAEANFIEDFLAENGPYTGGNPGPFLPGPEQEELVTDIMVDILLEQQFGLENYNYDAPIFNRKRTELKRDKNRGEWIYFGGYWIVILHDDVVIFDENVLKEPARTEGVDGDDEWDVTQER